MNKFSWIIGVISFGLFINICILYWIFFSLSSRLDQLVLPTAQYTEEPSPTLLPSETASLVTTDSAQTCSTCSDDIKLLRNAVNQLAKQIATSTPQVTKPISIDASTVKEVSISLGSGETKANDWEDVPGLNAYVNTVNYNTITEVKFEGTLSVPNANGLVYARLYNKTDSHPVWNSEFSSETSIPAFKQSSTITLDPGNKLYQVQMKSTLKDRAVIESARIKIFLK